MKPDFATMKMISLDTNIVLRFILSEDAGQVAAIADLINNNDVYITEVVCVEVVYVLEKVYHLSRADIVKLIGDFMALPTMTITWYLPDMLALYARRPALSIVDCNSATEAKVYANQLVTLDKKLVSQGGDHIRSL